MLEVLFEIVIVILIFGGVIFYQVKNIKEEEKKHDAYINSLFEEKDELYSKQITYESAKRIKEIEYLLRLEGYFIE